MSEMKFIILCSVLLCYGCNTTKTSANTEVVVPQTATVIDEDTEILSVVIQVQRGAPDTYHIHKVSKTKGYLKRETTSPQESAGFDFQIDAVDANGLVLKELYHHNPFQQTLEYSPEPKQLATVTVEEETPVLLIKMNWLPNIHSLVLKKRKDGVVVQTDKIALPL